MRIRLAVEDMEPNHWIAWALDLPACFCAAATDAEAISRAPQKIADYFTWLSNQDGSLPTINEPIQVAVVETFHSFASARDPAYIVNAFFEDDHRPLGYWDVEVALRLLELTRQDLLSVVQSATQAQRTATIPGEVHGSILGILGHIGIAENWYLEHLDCALRREQLPSDPLEQLAAVRRNTRDQLTRMIGDERVTESYDELWSARKIVRRTLWHERDHTQHIAQLLDGL